MDFEGFGKIPRLKSDIVVTEKLDGTNAQIYIVNDASEDLVNDWKPQYEPQRVAHKDGFSLFVGSRKRYITPADDNYGFARWVAERGTELIDFLGEGRHFGEWWGQGIQRRYDMEEKVLSLFNTSRWGEGRQELPDYLSVVPTLFQGELKGDMDIDSIMTKLKDEGSIAAPGFMNPEGVIVFSMASRNFAKTTFEYDKGKWNA